MTLYEIKNILQSHEPDMPVDDLRVINSWSEYEDKPSKSPEKRNLEYMCYELEVMNPETGKVARVFKAIRFVRVYRLPASAKQSTSFMKLHKEVLSGVYEGGYNLVSVIANMMEPALGLLYLYGIQGVAEGIEDAKKEARLGFTAFVSMMQGKFQTLELMRVTAEEAEWLKDKMYNMEFLTTVRGIPKADNAGVDAGNKGMGNANINPDSQGTLEEIITAMSDYEYIIEVLSTPVSKRTLVGWQERSHKEMTQWYSQLQGTKSLSMNISIPMSYVSNMSSGSGWSRGTSESMSHSTSHGESYTTTQGETIGDSINHSYGHTSGQSVGHSYGESVGHSYGESVGTSYGHSFGQSTGMSVGHSTGTSSGQSLSINEGQSSSLNVSESQNVSQGTNQSYNHGVSHGQSVGFSQSHSEGTNYGVSAGQSVSQSHNVGTSQGYSFGQNSSVTQNMGASYGSSHQSSSSHSEGGGGSYTEGGSHSDTSTDTRGYSSGKSESVGASVSAFGTVGVNGSTGTNESESSSHSKGSSDTTSNSYTDSSNYSDSSSVSNGSSSSITASQGTSQGSSFSQSFSGTESYGTGESRSLSQNWGASSTDSSSKTFSSNASTSDSVGFGQSSSISAGKSAGMSQGQTSGISMGQTAGKSQSSSLSMSQTQSETVSQSVSQTQSQSVSSTQSQSVSNTQSESDSETVGYGQSKSTSNSVSNGKSESTSDGTSSGTSMGTSGTTSFGSSSSMGFGPSIGYSKSYQWLDQGVKDLIEIMDYQNERLKRALRGEGAFYTYIYIACDSEDALSAAQAAAKATWQNDMAMVQPLQVLDLTELEQKHLLYHFMAFSSDITKEDVYGVREYKYCTVLLPEEFVAYTHLPRVSAGGVWTTVQDIPKFATPSNMHGEIYMGTVLNTERFTMNNGYRTQSDYRIDESMLMHGFFTGASRSGKTVAATRFISELSHIRRSSTGKRLRIAVMDPKQDWRALARYVEPERFRFYSMGNTKFHPIKMNPWKVPEGVQPQIWIDNVIDCWCRSYGLLERGKIMVAQVVYELYEKAGVFAICDTNPEQVPELSSKVSFSEIAKSMERKRDALIGGGRAGNDTKDAYERLIERLSCFLRPFSIESRLYGSTEGLGIDELIGDDDVTVFESMGLENTFQNFIFGAITSGFYHYAKAHEGGFLAEDQYETVLVVEEANKVLTGNETAGGKNSGPSLTGQSVFEEILDQSAGYGLFICAITQTIADMPKSIIANSGMVFAGRMKTAEDINVVVRTVGREERIDDRDLVKWFPRAATGWFVCQMSRAFDFKDAEPVLVQIARLNLSPPSNRELDAILTQNKVHQLLNAN